MAKKSEKAYRSFIKGLVTEANELTFPENASIDEQNFVLKRDGSRIRRLGIDYEELYSLTSTGLTTTDIKEGKQSFHIWNNPGGDTTVSLGIVRIKNRLWFLNMLSTTPSANKKNSGNYITISGLSNADIDVSVINNKCVIVSEDLSDPVLLSYNASTDTVTQSIIDIKVRDIWGVDDSLNVDTRPTTLSNTHKYNLRNQGWNKNIVTTTGADAIDRTFTVTGQYPSNADQWSLGKISNPSSADYEKYDPDTLLKNSNSNYQIAKGSFIIDAFTRGSSRQTVSDVTSGLPIDSEQGTITTVASYAQRIFYSGIGSSVTGSDSRSPNYSGYIFFSKVIQNDEDFAKCYQEADPTDPGISDLVASDGGTAHIPDATKIIKIAASRSSLVIFAENGVWELYGDTGGFFATSFQVSKVSTNGVLNANSIVDVNGTFLYWSKAGIYILTPDNVSGRFAAESLSLTSIQTLFLDIPATGKNNCKGFYDEKENQVRWLYNDSSSYSATNYINRYNKELVYDLTLQAWYKNTLNETSTPFVASYVEIPTYAVQGTEEGVYKDTDAVIVTSTDAVVVTTDIGINRNSQFSFLTMSGTSFTISKYIDTTFTDWKSHDSTGLDYSSYLVTGYELFGDVMREKQIPYIFFYFNRTENGYSSATGTLELTNQSSCKVQSQWSWTNSANSGKWGNEFQAYRLLRNYIPSGPTDPFDYGEGVIVTKNKLRGSGKCISLKISSETKKDMQILGWGHPVVITDVH